MLAEVNRFFVNPKLTSLGIWHCDILPKSTFLMREILTLPTCSDSVPTFTRQSTPPGDMDPEAPSEPDPEVLPGHGPSRNITLGRSWTLEVVVICCYEGHLDVLDR